MTRATLLIASIAASALPAAAADVYVLSSGDAATDSAALAALTAGGHTPTLGVQYPQFDGTQSLAGFRTVYLQANYNWGLGLMPGAGQQALTDWVTAGGRLVTCEWVIYYTYSGGSFGDLGAILPLEQSFTYGSLLSATYQMVTPDPAINAGLPAQFSFPLTSYAGTEIFTTAKPGATTYYSTQNGGSAGLAGWSRGQGQVYSFSTTCGPDQLADANFARLLNNVIGAGGGGCYPNCDGSIASPILNVQDFTCFLQRYAAGEAYANCDNSTNPPVLNVQDFTCFLQRYAAGCR